MDFYTSINFHSIREIESLVLKNESTINSFLPVSQRRLLNVKSLRRSIYRGWNPGVNDFEFSRRWMRITCSCNTCPPSSTLGRAKNAPAWVATRNVEKHRAQTGPDRWPWDILSRNSRTSQAIQARIRFIM